ncbi:Lrp/AsnC family transcriptional regulator [Phaeobacter gallaeciensis]|uniref:Lrp/AsnC family transcriptional regulator n=2 Tax=Roseobacteraceae TaxID=2854170 RepID=A0A366WY05_9RHOB|nr:MULTISPECIES: Lrp/AsnC family transcriptional regulator [Roseobacteraceae]MBT3143493.1 Lrp/AsnC family transcriptional regulator [Falsiruegeria litorea]MBT8167763.1 Lrp/AsnC family transcriptional regulator [Falsiruegeria litorea]RBW55558.1 Lrp/AsnC family transcriptional regulator [Phaeobacter gallaeciensis]
MTLDRTNLHILALLERNARLSSAAIGREVGLSRPAVQERIAKLERDKVITGYRAEIASDADQSVRAVIFVHIAERPCGPALRWLADLRGVQSVVSLAGEYDAVVQVAVASTEELAQLNDTIGAHRLIARSKTQIVLQTL